MRLRILIALLLSIGTLAALFTLCPEKELIPEFYAKNIRGSLFTGFLTVGSFLLSLKAFIVVKLKENIFDTDLYKKRLEERRKLNKSLTLYGPVKRLSTLLFVSISTAITASVSQLTIGLIPHWAATSFCIFVAVFAISMLVSTLILIKSTLDEWLEYLEEEHDKKTAQSE